MRRTANKRKVRAELRRGIVRVWFGDYLHLRLRAAKVAGLQSYYGNVTGYWCIELTFDDGAQITTEYDSMAKFAAVLSALDRVLP